MIITEAPEITAGITEAVRTRIAAEKMAVLQETLPIIMAVLLQTAAQEARQPVDVERLTMARITLRRQLIRT